MEILALVGVALIAGVLLVVLRGLGRPELAMLLSLLTGAVLLLAVLGKVFGVVDLLEALGRRSGVDGGQIGVLLKVIGIAYVADFGTAVLRDAGEAALAQKVELAGKAAILLLAVPLVLAILDTVLRLLA